MQTDRIDAERRRLAVPRDAIRPLGDARPGGGTDDPGTRNGKLLGLDASDERSRQGAGVPEMRFHDLRNCAMSFLIVAGLPNNVVSEMLGHTLTATTIDIYSHVLPLAHRDAADTLERFLG